MVLRYSVRSCFKRAGILFFLVGTGTAAWYFIEHHALHLDELRQLNAVRPGMTEAEVVAIMGRPPGMYGPTGAKYGVSMWEG